MSDVQPVLEPVSWTEPVLEPPPLETGPFVPVHPLSPSEARGRRRDVLELVTATSDGSDWSPTTISLTTDAAGALAQDPLAVVVRSGNALKRSLRLVVPSTSALTGVLVSPSSAPGWPNSAWLEPGYWLDVTDSDLYVSTAGAPGVAQANASGWLVVVTYMFTPGFLEGREHS